MTLKEKEKLVKQAVRLYQLGIVIEKQRNELCCMLENKVPYDSPEILVILKKLQLAYCEWKQLEQKHIDYRNSLGV
jgi:hypothetical protein